MSVLNMTIEPLGGQLMSEAFLGLAHSLAGKEETYELFHKDTGDDLKVLLMCESKELVAKYFDWVAMRYWGVQCHPMKQEHVKGVYALIKSVEQPPEVFIKSSEAEIERFIGESLIVYKADEIVGVLMVKDGYIDTIVSSVKGMGMHLLSSLPEGGYCVNVAEGNKTSLKLFKKFGFKHVRDEVICEQKRGLYEGQIKH